MMNLIARGRDCDIFDLRNGTVLRRRRDGQSLEAEAVVMRHVLNHNFPCPRVHEVSGADMVLDLLDGPTMAQNVMLDPTDRRARAAGVELARLHQELHRVPPMPGSEGALLHLDLHPENVVLTTDGPVVVDWTNASDGPPELDIAMTWVILEPFAHALPIARELLDAFLDAVGRQAARAGLAPAAARRLSDPNVTDEERAAVTALRESESTS